MGWLSRRKERKERAKRIADATKLWAGSVGRNPFLNPFYKEIKLGEFLDKCMYLSSTTMEKPTSQHDISGD